MSVDIVMRTKDRPVFLARALDDVLAQTFTDWRLTIVNDGTLADLYQKADDALAIDPTLRTRS